MADLPLALDPTPLGAYVESDIIERTENRSNMPGTLLEEVVVGTEQIPYGMLNTKNPEYDFPYWEKLKAFYAGGKALSDSKRFREYFPQHKAEHASVYQERCRRSFYIPYAGEIIDHIVAALTAQPVHMTTEATGKDSWPDYYDAFEKDVSPPGGKRQSLNQLLKEQVLMALICKRAWTLVEMPRSPDEGFYSLKGQEESGQMDAYAQAVDPASVIDWEEDESGELEWAIVRCVFRKRNGIRGDRSTITEEFVYYTREDWKKYEISYRVDQPPKELQPVGMVDSGSHSFGKVPLLRLEVSDGLWAMSKLEPLAREHFNKRCALAWAETMSLLPDLYEFEGPEDMSPGSPISIHQEDEDRAVNQKRGQGYVQVRGHQDRAEFVGPSSTPFSFALDSCNSIRDEMHRVTHQMALTVDNSSAALRRSGESKSIDKAATAVVLVALGRIVREHAEDLYAAVTTGRQDTLDGVWSARGMEKFDSIQTADAIRQAVELDSLEIESPTFRKRHRFGLAKLVLGDDATPEDIEDIEDELEKNITTENLIGGGSNEMLGLGDSPEDSLDGSPGTQHIDKRIRLKNTGTSDAVTIKKDPNKRPLNAASAPR